MERAAPVAVDAMGGDHAPAAIVQGAINAARKGVAVALVGPEGRLREELRRHRAGQGLPIAVHHASEVVEMDDHPGQAMRRKRDNSIRACFELVKRGQACGMVSAGNSGAVMAGAIFVLGRIPAVDRPAIVTLLPTLTGRPTLLLDGGANVECTPLHVLQFALMGEVFARRVLGIAHPRVAVLSNGEEESKGTELTRAASAALRRAAVDFRGYCEGRDLLTGHFDVIATDGFTGNVALKTVEGTAKVVGDFFRQALRSSTASKIGALLAQSALQGLRRRIDWRETGGAPLLGVKGVCLISHGRSDSLAMENAVRRVRDAAQAEITGAIAESLAGSERLLAPAPRRTSPHPV